MNPVGTGERLVRRFGRQVVATMMVVLGLAMLDLGPRASAAFLPVMSLTPNFDIAAGGTAGSEAPDTDRELQVWPPRSADVRLVESAVNGQQLPSGGAGSSSTSSSGFGHSTALPASILEVPCESVVAHLQMAALSLCPQLLISAIFEPPRVGI
jgi:hypothetical protein